jgi:hypothetical protein
VRRAGHPLLDNNVVDFFYEQVWFFGATLHPCEDTVYILAFSTHPKSMCNKIESFEVIAFFYWSTVTA